MLCFILNNSSVRLFVVFCLLSGFFSNSSPAVAQRDGEALSAEQVWGYYAAVEANCLAWRRGDVLIREQNVYDSTDVDANGVRGRFSNDETYSRILFDFDRERYLKLSLRVIRKRDYNANDNAGHNEAGELNTDSELTGVLFDNEKQEFFVAKKFAGQMRVVQRPVPKKRAPMSFLESYGILDLRYYWLDEIPTQKRLSLFSIETHKKAAARLHRSGRFSGDEIVISTRPSDDLLVGNEPFITSKATFDTQRMVRLSHVMYAQAQGTPVIEQFRKNLEWESKNDVYLLKQIRKTTFEVERDQTGENVEGVGDRVHTFDFHWFSINEDLNEEYFESNRLKDIDSLMELIDPRRAGADSLLPRSED